MARGGLFYGWVMLFIAIAGQFATGPGQTYGISVFNEYFREDLELSHTAVAGAYMLGTLLAALPIGFLGGWMDRYGIRRPMTLVVVLFGATCIATSQVTGLISLFFAFLMLRMLGQGALSLLSSTTVSMWFHVRLGTAVGLMSMGSAVAFAVIPSLNLYLINELGWRTAYVVLGIAVWVLMLPLLAFFYRNRPEDIGQVLDRARPLAETEPEDHKSRSTIWFMTLPEARRTRAFWILLSMHVVWALVGTAIVFHLVSLFESRHLSKIDATLFFTCFAVSMATAQFFGGFLADVCPLKILLAVSLTCMTLSVAFLTVVESSSAVKVCATTFGASQGLFMVIGQTIWARYYGREHLGKIRGAIWTASVAGSSVGPFLMGLAKDSTGSYTPALWIFVAMYGTLALSAFAADAPARSIDEPSPALVEL